MPRNGDRNSSSFSESIPLGSLSSGRSEHLTVSLPQPSDRQNSDQEGHGDDRLPDKDATPPSLGVKLTVYRLVFMTTVLSFGAAKSILAYKGQSIAPTTLDWVSGTFFSLVLYWISLYEESNKWKWFFQVDLAPAIGHCAMCGLAEFICLLLFDFDGKPVFVILLCSLNWLIVFVNACYFPDAPPNALTAVHFGTSIFVLLLFFGIRRNPLRFRVLEWGLDCLMRFVDTYGPDAGKYGRFGSVAILVRGLCGIALICLPLMAFVVTSPDTC